MSPAIDGLVSGLDTAALISSLMQVEAVPQTQLRNKVTSAQNLISSLQALNGKVSALADLATKTSAPTAVELYTTTSSSPKVTAATTASAAPGQLDVVVTSLAAGQKSVTAAMASWPDSPPTLSIVDSAGTVTEITAASSSLDDVVKAVNASGAGVTATKVAVGAAGFRIQFASAATGLASAFTLNSGSVAGGTAVPLAVTDVSTAKDAAVTLWAGTSAAQTVTSSTNTFSQLMPGVTITVGAMSPDPVTITVARDDAKIAATAAGLVTALNDIFSFVDARTAVSTTTGPTGLSVTKSGIFSGDSAVRDIDQRLLRAASMPVGGRSPSEIGISITKSGSMEFDQKKFTAAMETDAVGTGAMMREIATRVAAVASDASDRYDGQLTTKITGQQSSVRDLGDRIEDWTRRLDMRRSSLERTYSALEVQLSNLNSQSTWLSGQIASLSGSGS